MQHPHAVLAGCMQHASSGPALGHPQAKLHVPAGAHVCVGQSTKRLIHVAAVKPRSSGFKDLSSTLRSMANVST
jgi:hypothetical protein